MPAEDSFLCTISRERDLVVSQAKLSINTLLFLHPTIKSYMQENNHLKPFAPMFRLLPKHLPLLASTGINCTKALEFSGNVTARPACLRSLKAQLLPKDLEQSHPVLGVNCNFA